MDKVILGIYCALWSIWIGFFYYRKSARVKARLALLPFIISVCFSLFVYFENIKYLFICLLLVSSSLVYYYKGALEVKNNKRSPDKVISKKSESIQFIVFILSYAILVVVVDIWIRRGIGFTP